MPVTGKRKRVYAPKTVKVVKYGPKRLSERAGVSKKGSSSSCILKYAEDFTLNGGAAGVTDNYQFRLNSIFDPNFTGVGHQPVNHDQLSAIFERYKVYRIDYKVVIIGNSTVNTIGGVFVSDQFASSTDPRVYVENGMCDWTLFESVDTNACRTITGSISVPDVMGVSYKEYMSEEDYGAAFGANPVDGGVLTVFNAGLDGADPGTSNCFIELTYHTKVYGTKINSLS